MVEIFTADQFRAAAANTRDNPKLAAMLQQAAADRADLEREAERNDRSFIERAWQYGQNSARLDVRDKVRTGNAYDPSSLAGLWWQRGYDAARVRATLDDITAPSCGAGISPAGWTTALKCELPNGHMGQHVALSGAADEMRWD